MGLLTKRGRGGRDGGARPVKRPRHTGGGSTRADRTCDAYSNTRPSARMMGVSPMTPGPSICTARRSGREAARAALWQQVNAPLQAALQGHRLHAE